MGILTANRHTRTSKIRQLKAIMLLYPVSHAQLATLSPPTNSTDFDNPYTTTLSTNPMITTAPASPLSPRPQILFRPQSYRLQESRSEADMLSLFPATSNFIPVTSDSNTKTHGTWTSWDLVYTYLAVPAVSSPTHVPPLLVILIFTPAVPT